MLRQDGTSWLHFHTVCGFTSILATSQASIPRFPFAAAASTIERQSLVDVKSLPPEGRFPSTPLNPHTTNMTLSSHSLLLLVTLSLSVLQLCSAAQAYPIGINRPQFRYDDDSADAAEYRFDDDDFGSLFDDDVEQTSFFRKKNRHAAGHGSYYGTECKKYDACVQEAVKNGGDGSNCRKLYRCGMYGLNVHSDDDMFRIGQGRNKFKCLSYGICLRAAARNGGDGSNCHRPYSFCDKYYNQDGTRKRSNRYRGCKEYRKCMIAARVNGGDASSCQQPKGSCAEDDDDDMRVAPWNNQGLGRYRLMGCINYAQCVVSDLKNGGDGSSCSTRYNCDNHLAASLRHHGLSHLYNGRNEDDMFEQANQEQKVPKTIMVKNCAILNVYPSRVRCFTHPKEVMMTPSEYERWTRRNQFAK